MVFYIDAYGKNIEEYIAEHGEFIGILNGNDGKKLVPDDISIDKIENHLYNDKFLVALILNNTWWVCILFNNLDGANEVKTKYKGKQMIWYWLDRIYIKDCLPNMKYKEFEKLFPCIERN